MPLSRDVLAKYDGLHRLKTAGRGELNSTENPANDRLTALKFSQGWQLDPTGNWSRFTQFDQASQTSSLDQGGKTGQNGSELF